MLSCPVAGRASGIAPWVPLPNKTSPGWGHDARLHHGALWPTPHHEHCRRAGYSHSCSTPSFSCLTEQ